MKIYIQIKCLKSYYNKIILLKLLICSNTMVSYFLIQAAFKNICQAFYTIKYIYLKNIYFLLISLFLNFIVSIFIKNLSNHIFIHFYNIRSIEMSKKYLLRFRKIYLNYSKVKNLIKFNSNNAIIPLQSFKIIKRYYGFKYNFVFKKLAISLKIVRKFSLLKTIINNFFFIFQILLFSL